MRKVAGARHLLILPNNRRAKYPSRKPSRSFELGAARSSVGHLMFDGLVCDSGQFTHQGVILKGLVCELGGFTHRGVQDVRVKVGWEIRIFVVL